MGVADIIPQRTFRIKYEEKTGTCFTIVVNSIQDDNEAH